LQTYGPKRACYWSDVFGKFSKISKDGCRKLRMPSKRRLSNIRLQNCCSLNSLNKGPLASADKDPPSDFVTNIPNLVNEEKHGTDSCQEVSRTISRAFWDAARMFIHPQLFDYPTETGVRSMRKTTPTTIAASLGPPSFEEALQLFRGSFLTGFRNQNFRL
jgi:hypothetical protein